MKINKKLIKKLAKSMTDKQYDKLVDLRNLEKIKNPDKKRQINGKKLLHELIDKQDNGEM